MRTLEYSPFTDFEDVPDTIEVESMEATVLSGAEPSDEKNEALSPPPNPQPSSAVSPEGATTIKSKGRKPTRMLTIRASKK